MRQDRTSWRPAGKGRSAVSEPGWGAERAAVVKDVTPLPGGPVLSASSPEPP